MAFRADFLQNKGGLSNKVVVFGISRRDLFLDASLGVSIPIIVEKIGLEIRPSACLFLHVMQYCSCPAGVASSARQGQLNLLNTEMIRRPSPQGR